MENNKLKLIPPSEYASIKGVVPSRITYLKKIGDLKVEKKGVKWLVVDCDHNDSLFENPSHKRGKRTVRKMSLLVLLWLLWDFFKGLKTGRSKHPASIILFVFMSTVMIAVSIMEIKIYT